MVFFTRTRPKGGPEGPIHTAWQCLEATARDTAAWWLVPAHLLAGARLTARRSRAVLRVLRARHLLRTAGAAARRALGAGVLRSNRAAADGTRDRTRRRVRARRPHGLRGAARWGPAGRRRVRRRIQRRRPLQRGRLGAGRRRAWLWRSGGRALHTHERSPSQAPPR